MKHLFVSRFKKDLSELRSKQKYIEQPSYLIRNITLNELNRNFLIKYFGFKNFMITFEYSTRNDITASPSPSRHRH